MAKPFKESPNCLKERRQTLKENADYLKEKADYLKENAKPLKETAFSFKENGILPTVFRRFWQEKAAEVKSRHKNRKTTFFGKAGQKTAVFLKDWEKAANWPKRVFWFVKAGLFSFQLAGGMVLRR